MRRLCCAALVLYVSSSLLRGQERTPPLDDSHRELLAVREAVIAAVNKNDIDALLEHVHPNVVLTAPSFLPGKEVSRGHAGVRAYYDRMFTGPNRHANKVTCEVKLDEPSIVYGDSTDIAWGSSLDTYDLVGGTKFTVATRWSGTLVKENGQWLIAEFHISISPFDNPILTEVKTKTTYFAGGLAGGGGLLLGLLLGVAMARRRKLANGVR